MATINSRVTLPKETLLPLRLGRLGLNGLILDLWLWLYRPVFDYLRIIFSQEGFHTNQVVPIGILVLIFFRIRQARLRPWGAASLKELAQGADRFAREAEAAGETAQAGLQVTGVPEPEEWMLLALAAALLMGWTIRTRRLANYR